jgi:hypothetical protein
MRYGIAGYQLIPAASAEGMYTSILHGLLTGFLFPLIPIFWFRELPLPNFFDAEAEAMAAAGRSASRSGTGARAGGDTRGTGAAGGRGGSGGGGGGAGGGEGSSESSRTLPSERMGEEVVSSSVFGKRMRVSGGAVTALHGSAHPGSPFFDLDQICSRTVRGNGNGIWELADQDADGHRPGHDCELCVWRVALLELKAGFQRIILSRIRHRETSDAVDSLPCTCYDVLHTIVLPLVREVRKRLLVGGQIRA